MRIGSWFSADAEDHHFRNYERFFEGLKASEHRAIVHLQAKAMPTVRRLVSGYGLPAEQAEEILNDATLIFLKKIQTDAYQFVGYNPTTYCLEIAKRLALMATRHRQQPTEDLENLSDSDDPDAAALLAHRETADVVHQLLTHLGAPCDQVIRLHHIDGYSDEEVIRQGWTAYGSTASLKVKRSDCMKKLAELAQLWKKNNPI
jgi:DNA-directed RNA polymerase specialized sigma24 family protein